MPGMSGPVAAERLQALRPGTRVLLMSGYTDAAIGRDGALDSRAHFIQKPFSASALLAKVREVLAGPPGQGTGA
jgi:FixJ family two-component response regulator